MNNYRLMAIDDDPGILDAYRSLFLPASLSGNRVMGRVLDLIGIGESGAESESESEDVDFEFSLDCFSSGQAGAEALRQSLREGSPYAVLFLDMRMPNGWSGLETARVVRKLDESVRIVLVSAYTDHTLQEIRAEIGPRFVFHSKPWNDQEMGQLTRLLVSDWEYERELQATQQRLQQTVSELAHATRAKDRFLASMSHELRTPLAAMLGYGELLEETPLQQEQRTLLKTMQVSGSSLLYLLNDMLDLSKIESGKFQIDHAPYSLLQVVQEVEQIFAVRAENRGLLFELVVERNAAIFQHQLLGDGKRLTQILINLVSNAVKFTPQGYVRLSVDSDEQWLRCRVEDSGIGMEAVVMERLFRPFEQADRSISARFGGTGLGLHISKTLARLMGGDITVESEAGSGSQFEVTIPLELGERLPTVALEQRTTEPERVLSGSVLIAEDVPEMKILIRRMVERPGIKVEVVEHGERALERALSASFDLILMDMQMPVMDGVEATRALRSLSNYTPVVALTANAMQVHRQEFEEAGCNGFLSKPIDREALERTLEEYLQSGPTAALAEPSVDDELMAVFASSMRGRTTELAAALDAQQWQQLHEIIHSIKGSAASFGYLQLGKLAAAASEAYHREEMEQFSAAAALLLEEMVEFRE
jgi:two-component system sensor histidine kinase/response regulator